MPPKKGVTFKAMDTAVTEGEFEEWKATGKTKKKVKPAPPGSDPGYVPEFKDLITKDNIDVSKISRFGVGIRQPRRDKRGVMNVGFFVEFVQDGNKISGWVDEGLYQSLRRQLYVDGNVNLDGMEV